MVADGRPPIALSFDIEEWFQTEVAESGYRRNEWNGLESRIQEPMESLLAILDEHHGTATFFFLGWIAEKYPDLLRRVAAAGHEIASHGHSHRCITAMSPLELGEELELVGQAFQRCGCERPKGFRAPSFTLVEETMWAVDVLLDAGYEYDSSVYPMFKHRYGMPGAPLSPFLLKSGSGRAITELPMAVSTLGSLRIPAAGGAYLRFFPAPVYIWLLRRISARGRTPVFYLHPWELDSGVPLSRLSLKQRFRQRYRAGRYTEKILRLLLTEFRPVALNSLCQQAGDIEEWAPGM